MLEREKFGSSAAIATALAVSGENQTNPDSEGTKLSLYLPNERYTCNPDNLYAVPRIDLHEIEWIEADSIEADVSRFVTGSSTATTTTRNNQRRCCRTSTSSGYSSHSPPLSAGSYSCYASAAPGQSFFRSVPLTMKDQFSGGLPVIHESDSIPRPIWPTVFPSPRELYHNDESPEYDTLYACCGCGCAYSYSYCDWDYEKSAGTSAHDVLLELSRTLNSVIEGKNAMTPEEILHNISYKVAQGIGLKGGLYEYVYHNSPFSPSQRSFLNEKNSCLLSCSKNSSSKVNPVNSKLYNNARHFYLHNPAWYTGLCACEHTRKFQSSSKSDAQTEASDELEKKESPPVVLLMDDHYRNTNSESALQNNKNTSKLNVCKCLNRLNSLDGKMQNLYANKSDTKETINVHEGDKQNRNQVISNGSEYTMQLECSDGDTFNKGIVFSSYKNNWDYRMQGFAGDFDFTLDVSRAERLGHVIAKAKRKRQWCKALTAFFGLVFFVLSVVIVSLSVTRGRKVFGSM
ncbi:hypothetical protein ANTPLA_LOCUS2222 [Anthophora plagiata]